MKYQFIEDKAEKVKLEFPEGGLIPHTLDRAQQVNPDPSVAPFWEGRIYKDLEGDRPSNWGEFVRSLIP